MLAGYPIGPAIRQRSVEELQRLAQCARDSRASERLIELGATYTHGVGGQGTPAEQPGERAPLAGLEVGQGELIARRASLISSAQPQA